MVDCVEQRRLSIRLVMVGEWLIRVQYCLALIITQCTSPRKPRIQDAKPLISRIQGTNRLRNPNMTQIEDTPFLKIYILIVHSRSIWIFLSEEKPTNPPGLAQPRSTSPSFRPCSASILWSPLLAPHRATCAWDVTLQVLSLGVWDSLDLEHQR